MSAKLSDSAITAILGGALPSTSLFYLVDPTDTTTPPSGAGGSSKKITAAQLGVYMETLMLPLGGGTLTGQLNGTSASFSGTVTLGGQTANTFLAGPSSGTATATTMRTLVAADIPNLSGAKVTSGTVGVSVLPRTLQDQFVITSGTTDFDGTAVVVNTGSGVWSGSGSGNTITINASNPFVSPYWTLVAANGGTGTSNTYTSVTLSDQPNGTFAFSSGNGTGTGSAVVSSIPTFGTFSYITGGDSQPLVFYTNNTAGAATERFRIGGSVTTATMTTTGNASFTGAILGVTGITSSAGTLTSNAPGLSLTQTWNSSSTSFNGLLVNIAANTASSSTSRPLKVVVGGTTVFDVSAAGAFTLGGVTLNQFGILDLAGGNINRSSSLNSTSQLSLNNANFSGTGSQTSVSLASGTISTSTGTFFAANVGPTMSTTGSAGWSILRANPTLTSDTSTGTKLVLDLGTGGTTLVSVDSLGRFFPLQAATVSAPAYVKGGMYFDTTLNKLRIGGATAWETVTSV